jgi:hypothetical protein
MRCEVLGRLWRISSVKAHWEEIHVPDIPDCIMNSDGETIQHDVKCSLTMEAYLLEGVVMVGCALYELPR